MANGQPIVSQFLNDQPSEAQVQSGRKAMLREIRRRERSLDSQLEIWERRIFKLLARKTLLSPQVFVEMADNYNKLLPKLKDCERAIRDALYVVTQ